MRRSIRRLAKSALVNTHELYQTKNILAQTEIAQQARSKQQGTKRGSLQKGGVLYAHHARYMVREHEGNALRQAEALIKHHKEKAKKKLRERELNRLLIDIRKAGQARLRRIREHGLESCDLYELGLFKVV